MNFKQTVKMSHIEGGFYALMVASAENFLFYFAVKHQVNSFQLALLSTLPLFMGAISQLIIPRFVNESQVGMSVVLTMLIQLLGLFGLSYIAFVKYNYFLLLFFTCLYFSGGLTSAPLWFDWASRIIPQKNFRKYIANRSSYTWYLILIFYISLAFLCERTFWFELKFVFIIGAMARLISSFIQILITKGKFNRLKEYDLKNKVKKISSEKIELKKLIYIFIIMTSLFRFAVMMSGAFFISYMIDDLKLSLLHYSLLASFPFLGRAFFFKKWGKIGMGNNSFYGVLLTMLYISFIPIVWTLSNSFTFLLIAEFISGIAWGGFELNQILMIQNFSHNNSRQILGVHMALTNIFGILGAITGSYLIDAQITYRQLFIISAITRLLVSAITVLIVHKNKVGINAKDYGSYVKKLLPLS